MAVYYVTKAGNDGNPGTLALPKLTVGAGLSLLSSGDTLRIGAGTYTDTPLGPTNIPNGSSGAPTVIETLDGQTVILRPTDLSLGVAHFSASFGTLYHDVTLRGPGLILDGSNTVQSVAVFIKDGAHHIVLEDLEVRNCGLHGIDFGGGEPPLVQHDCRLSRVKIHNTGTNITTIQPPAAYGIYLNGQQQTVENCEIYDCLSGWGIHAYAGGNRFVDRVTIRNNWIHNCNTNATDPNGSGGLLLWSHNGTSNRIYNNIFSANRNTMATIYLAEGAQNLFVNNTLYGNLGGGISIRVGGASGWTLQNNIIWSNTNGTISFNDGQGSNILGPNVIGVDPHFVNQAASDFHLQSDSIAIGAGVNLSSVFTTDYSGSPRPLSGPWTDGVYIFGSGGPPPPTGIPRGWWPLEDQFGTQAVDITGIGNHGTLTGSPLPTWVPGRLGKSALHFAGLKDAVNIPAASVFGNCTLALTLNADNAIIGTTTTIPLILLFSAPGNEISFNWDNSLVSFRQSWVIGVNGLYTPCQYVSALSPGTFYRLVLTYDGATMRVYLNGVIEATVASAPPQSTLTAAVLSATGAAGDWQGVIDEVRLENFVFSPTEIMSDFIRTFNPPLNGPSKTGIQPFIVR